MALVDEDEAIVGKVVEEGVGRLAGGAAVEPAGVVLDAVAETHLLEHLQIVEGALLEPLGLEQLALAPQRVEALLQLDPDPLDGTASGCCSVAT